MDEGEQTEERQNILLHKKNAMQRRFWPFWVLFELLTSISLIRLTNSNGFFLPLKSKGNQKYVVKNERNEKFFIINLKKM